MTSHLDLYQRATTNVCWLAHQPTGTWNPSPSRRELVEIVCDTSRWIHRATTRALHDLEPDLPDPYWLIAASESLDWCYRIANGGSRAQRAVVTLRQIGGDPNEYLSAWATVDDAAERLRNIIGRNHTPLDRDELAMVEANLGLARWAVRKWGRNLHPTDGTYSKADAYQDAVIGLTRAAKGYDPSLGNTFATYAYAYLYQAITIGEAKARGPAPRCVGADMEDMGCTDDGMERAEWSSLSSEMAEVVRRVCHDDIDRRMVEAIMAAPDGIWRTDALRPIADEFGMKLGTLTQRWYGLRDRLAECFGEQDGMVV